MSYQTDLRQRQSKRKIFLDDSYKSRGEERPNDFALLPKKQPIQLNPSQSSQQPKPKSENLQETVRELKNLLKEERQKYDQLFEEYEQLIEKNNLIEKEYINLKYEHNKELKNVKKSYKQKVEEEIKRCVEEFTAKINEDCLWEGIKLKIQKFIANLERISEIFLQKSKKYHNKDLHKTLDMIDIAKSTNFDQIIEQSKPQKVKKREIPTQQKIVTSPLKDPSKQFQQIMVNNSFNTKEIIFQDEYYGDLDDYEHLQQKIAQRKNYELLKNCNRNSTEIRRKKIFNKSAQFQ